MKRQKTSYPGVTFYIKEDGEKIYYIRYRQGGRGTKETEEPVGTSAQAMTPAKASQIRAARMSKKAPTNKEVRTERFRKKDAWTFKKIFEQYQATLEQGTAGRANDKSNFKRLCLIQDKELKEVTSLDIETVQRSMEKEGKAPQTIKHVLNLITRTNNYALKASLIQPHDGLSCLIRKPSVDCNKTENMNDEVLKRYLAVLDEEPDKDRAAILKLALFSGIRKSALLALKWKHIDFHHNLIELEGKTAKNRKTAFIPLNASCKDILCELQKGSPEEYLFPGLNGNKREDFRRMARRVKAKAGLPDDFRPMHGLRHTYASRLASSGKVDLYTLQKLLTHESPEMTQRYAHLSNEAMQRAAAVADDVMGIKKE